jgi:hypothetical protein
VAGAVLQLSMESDVEGLIGAGRYERITWRNGYRDRTLDTASVRCSFTRRLASALVVEFRHQKM